MILPDAACPAIAAAFSRRAVRAFLPASVRAREPMFRRSGSSFDLKTIREYQGSDDPRSIDWRLLARTDRAYVKEFRDEAGEGVAFLLDASASMEIFDREDYGRLVVSLGWLLGALGIAVEAAVFDEACAPRVTRLGRRGDARALASLFEATEFRGRTDIGRAVNSLRRRSAFRRLFLFSDFLDPRFDPRRQRFPDTFLFQLRAPFAALAPVEGELEIEDPETGGLLRAPWDAAEAARYEAEEEALRRKLSSAPRTGHWTLEKGADREAVYWAALERLHA